MSPPGRAEGECRSAQREGTPVSALPAEIRTNRLVLRAPSLADADDLYTSYTQDPAVCRYMVWAPHRSLAETQNFLVACVAAWQGESRRPYVICAGGQSKPLGMIEARLDSGTADIGYVLARLHWGLGFMPEAARALAASALSIPAFYRVQATCDTENIPSQRVLDKAGFHREGRLERYVVHPNLSSEPRACFMYAKCK